MAHSYCHHEVHVRGGVCPICGSFVQAAGTQSNTNPPAAPDIITPATRPSRLASGLYLTLSILCWLLILAANYVIAVRWSGRFDNETQGYMFEGCLAAFLFSYLVVWWYYRRKPIRPSSLKMAFLVSLWALVFTIPHFVGSKDSFTTRDAPVAQRTAVLMKEAPGELPLGPLNEEWEGPARDFFKDLVEENRRYQEETHDLDSAKLADLYSPDSYAGPAKVAKMIEELRVLEEVETKHYQAIASILERYKNRFRALNASEEDKEAYLRGVEKGLAESSDYEHLYAKEENWLQRSIELYQFALKNKKSFRVTNKAVSSSSAEFRSSFQSMQSRAISLRDDFVAAQAEFESKRKSRLEKMGLRPSDVGEDGPPPQQTISH